MADFLKSLKVKGIEIDTAGATTDQVLKYNGTKFLPTTGGGGATTLDDLTDVTAPSPTNGQFLKWNGTAWVNDTIDLGTDTTGDYVASLVAGTGVTLTNNSGEGATPTVAIGQAVATNSDVAFNSVTAGGVELGLFSGTITTSSGNLSISPASSNTIVYGSLSMTGGILVTGTTDVQEIREAVTDSSIDESNPMFPLMTCNYTSGGIFYQASAPNGNFSVNVTNLPTTNGKAITISIFVTQGSIGYMPDDLQIDGTSQTIKWAGGTAPTPTSSSGKIDLFTFTMIRRSSAWTVLGSANLNY